MKVEPAVSVKDGMTLSEEVLVKWKELLRDFLRDTSLQGCKNIPCKKRHIIVRVIWLLLVLAMAGMLLSALANLYNKYYSFNFTSKVTRESRQRLRLPAITICNQNRFDTSKRNLTSAELKFVLQKSSTQFMFKPVDWNGQEGRELDQIDHVKFWENVSYEAKDMFKFIHLKQFHKASSMIYSKRWNRRCFTFIDNAYDIRAQNTLTLLINIMQGTYLNGATYEAGVENERTWSVWNTETPNKTSMASVLISIFYSLLKETKDVGIKRIASQDNCYRLLTSVYIHEAEETSYSQPSSVAVPAGLSTRLKLSRKEMKYLPHPYNSRGMDCVDTKASDFVNPLEWFKHYSIAACRMECKIKAATAACNCSAGWEPHNVEVTLRHCSIKEVEVCYRKAYKMTKGARSCSCLQECEQTSHDIQVSFMPFKHNLSVLSAKLDELVDVPSADSLRHDHLVLDIGFSSMVVDRTEHVPTITRSEVFAIAGGDMGLFLGAGILTAIELLELMSACMYVGFMSLWARCKPRTS